MFTLQFFELLKTSSLNEFYQEVYCANYFE